MADSTQDLGPNSPPTDASASKSRFARAPIYPLTSFYLDDIRRHTMALSPRDRYMRFGLQVTDEQIDDYLRSIDFDNDDVFGVFDNNLNLIGVAHLAYSAPETTPSIAEFGVSVSESARGKGLGGQLFAHSALRARRNGIDQMFIHTQNKNVAMIKIIKHSGAEIFRDGSEVDAYLNLLSEPRNMWMDMHAIAQDNAAMVDFGIKVGLRFLKNLTPESDNAESPRVAEDPK